MADAKTHRDVPHASTASSHDTIKLPLCEFIKPNGIRCGSPARRGQTLCYFHSPDRPTLHRARRTYGPYPLPSSNDPHAIATALHRIMNDLLADRADLTYSRRALASIYSLVTRRASTIPTHLLHTDG